MAFGAVHAAVLKDHSILVPNALVVVGHSIGIVVNWNAVYEDANLAQAGCGRGLGLLNRIARDSEKVMAVRWG